MYKIITAIGNENINNEIKNLNKYNVIFPDIPYQEALLEIIKNNEIDKLIILDSLPGELDKFNLIDKIIEINQQIDIIVIKENEDKKYSKYLLVNGITKQINASNLRIDSLCDFIEEKKIFIAQEKNNPLDEIKTNNIKNFDKKIITINGTNCSGKTSFAVNLSICLANMNKKVLLIDLDTINANIDKFLGINLLNKNIITDLDDEKKCSLNYIIDCIQKEILDYEVFSKAVIEYTKNRNLSIITGNSSMYVCQNVLCENYYQTILDKANQIYDYIVIDTNSSMFLDSTKWALEKADIVYYLFEGTYKDVVSIKRSYYIYEKVWNICTQKINLILNKSSKYSLSVDSIEKLLNLKTFAKFEFDERYIEALNNAIPIVFNSQIEKNKYNQILGVGENENIFNKIKNSIKGVF